MDKKEITIYELAKLTKDLPIGGELNFSCQSFGNHWAIKKQKVFDGPIILIGSYGGGDTKSLDVQIDYSENNIKEFLKNALMNYHDPALDSLYLEIEDTKDELNLYETQIDEIRYNIKNEIISAMRKRSITSLNIRPYEVYVVWFDDCGEGQDTMIENVLLTSDNKIELEVNDQDNDETFILTSSQFSVNHVEWLVKILNAMNSKLKKYMAHKSIYLTVRLDIEDENLTDITQEQIEDIISEVNYEFKDYKNFRITSEICDINN